MSDDKPWHDIWLDAPTPEASYWIKPICGCVEPVQAIWWAGGTEWTVDMPSGTSATVPTWLYRWWREI